MSSLNIAIRQANSNMSIAHNQIAYIRARAANEPDSDKKERLEAIADDLTAMCDDMIHTLISDLEAVL